MGETDIIGGFPTAEPNCKGCGKPLLIENAWMADGCPCNHALGINSMNETRWRLLMQLQQREHSLCATMGLVSEQSSNAKAVEHHVGSLLLREQLHAAWKYATRAVNVCESMGISDTRQALADITVLLSQQLEFVETEVQSERIEMRRDERERGQYVPAGSHIVEDSDGERFVRSHAPPQNPPKGPFPTEVG